MFEPLDCFTEVDQPDAQDLAANKVARICQKLIKQMTAPETPNQPTKRLYLQVLLQDTMPVQALFNMEANICCVSQDTLWELPSL